MPTVLKDYTGPDCPLGWIEVAVPGTPVSIMKLIDPTEADAPETSNRISGRLYPTRFQQIKFQGFKPDTHGMQYNTGNVYVVRRTGNRDDTGLMIHVLRPGETWYLNSPPTSGAVFKP